MCIGAKEKPSNIRQKYRLHRALSVAVVVLYKNALKASKMPWEEYKQKKGVSTKWLIVNLDVIRLALF